MMFVIVQDLNTRNPPMLFVGPDNVSEEGVNRRLAELGFPERFKVSVLCADTPTVLGTDKEIAEFVSGSG